MAKAAQNQQSHFSWIVEKLRIRLRNRHEQVFGADMSMANCKGHLVGLATTKRRVADSTIGIDNIPWRILSLITKHGQHGIGDSAFICQCMEQVLRFDTVVVKVLAERSRQSQDLARGQLRGLATPEVCSSLNCIRCICQSVEKPNQISQVPAAGVESRRGEANIATLTTHRALNSMIQTTVVGSYPVPTWLKAHPSPEAYRDAVRAVLQLQEQAGIEVVSDGELTRWNAREFRPSGMVERFVAQMDGISVEASHAQRAAYRLRADVAYRGTPPGVVCGELGPGRLDLEEEWRLASGLTSRPLKFTVTSPYMIAKLLLDQWYARFDLLLTALATMLADQVASVGAAIIQVDEPNLPGSPADALLAAAAINQVLAKIRGEAAVHLCFGNFGGQRIQQGDYRQLLAFFNELRCDHLVLETTRRPLDEIRLLREVKSDTAFGFGVIDVKDLQVEDSALVAQRIEKLAGVVGVDRIRYVHPDCGLSHLPREVADRKLAALRAGRDLFIGGGARN